MGKPLPSATLFTHSQSHTHTAASLYHVGWEGRMRGLPCPPSCPISSTFFLLFTPSSLSFSSSSLALSLLDVVYVVGRVEAHHAVFQAPSAPALVVLVSYLGELLAFRTKRKTGRNGQMIMWKDGGRWACLSVEQLQKGFVTQPHSLFSVF